MSHKGRILVEHDGKVFDLRWETIQEKDHVGVEYTVNGQPLSEAISSDKADASVPHGAVIGEQFFTWLNSMVLCDILEHKAEKNRKENVDGFHDVEPISARMKPDNDVN